MSGNTNPHTVVSATRVINSCEDVISGDIILVDFPHVRPYFDKIIGKKVFSKERPSLVLYTKPRQMVAAYISSQIPATPDSADIVIEKSSPSFISTGLKNRSIIRLGVLATIPFEKVRGYLGSADGSLKADINSKIEINMKIR